MSEEHNEPKVVSPFKIIQRGEVTLVDDSVAFADFSPRVVPADTPDDRETTVPKAESAQVPAPSSESTLTIELETLDNPAPAPVDGDAGQPSQSDPLKLDSSSSQKNG